MRTHSKSGVPSLSLVICLFSQNGWSQGCDLDFAFTSSNTETPLRNLLLEAYWKKLLAQDVIAGAASAFSSVHNPLSQERRTQRLLFREGHFPHQCFGGVPGSEQSVICSLHIAGIIKTVPLLTRNRQHVTDMDLPLAASPAQPRLKPKQKKTSVLCVIRDVNTDPEVAHPTLDKPNCTEITKVQ